MTIIENYFENLRRYFNINNDYIKDKLKLLLFPFKNKVKKYNK
jgi:hypothetical protein